MSAHAVMCSSVLPSLSHNRSTRVCGHTNRHAYRKTHIHTHNTIRRRSAQLRERASYIKVHDRLIVLQLNMSESEPIVTSGAHQIGDVSPNRIAARIQHAWVCARGNHRCHNTLRKHERRQTYTYVYNPNNILSSVACHNNKSVICTCIADRKLIAAAKCSGAMPSLFSAFTQPRSTDATVSRSISSVSSYMFGLQSRRCSAVLPCLSYCRARTSQHPNRYKQITNTCNAGQK